MARRRFLTALGALGLGILWSQLLAGRATSLDGEPVAMLALLTLAVEGLLLALALSFALLGGDVSRALRLAPGRLPGRDVALLAVGTLALSHALDGVLRVSGLAEDSVLGEFPQLLAGIRGPRLLLALVAFALAPAVAEELLCRGLVQGALARRFGAGVGITAAALLFGVLHIEPIHAAFATLLGLYLGLVAHWGGSTRPAVVCHGANNAGAVALSALSIGPPGSLASVAAGFAVALACAWAVGRRAAARPPSAPGAPAPAVSAPPGSGLQPEPQSDDR